MTMRQFVKENREDITRASGGYCTNDSDRAQFVANDEGYYLYARSMGVRV